MGDPFILKTLWAVPKSQTLTRLEGLLEPHIWASSSPHNVQTWMMSIKPESMADKEIIEQPAHTVSSKKKINFKHQIKCDRRFKNAFYKQCTVMGTGWQAGWDLTTEPRQ